MRAIHRSTPVASAGQAATARIGTVQKKHTHLVLWFVIAAGLVLWAAPPAAAQAVPDALEIRKGFQQHPWGVHVDDVQGFSKLGVKNNAHFYVCPCVTYLIEGVNVPRVVYGFVEDKLYGVFIDITRKGVYEKLLAYITEKYGAPKVKEEAGEVVHRWNVDRVKIKLKDNIAEGVRKLSFYYRPLTAKVELSPFEQGDEDSEPEPISWSRRQPQETPTDIPLLRF